MSAREQRLWIAAGVWLASIYVAIFFARPVTDFLRARGALRFTVLAAFLLAAAVVLWQTWRRRPSGRELLAAAVCGGLYVLVLSQLARHEERLHFIEYGLFAGLVEAALRERRATWSGFIAVVITCSAGWIDEGIQGWVPERIYDLRDVVFNTLAGILAVTSVTLQRMARAPGGAA